jgi:hypothetical protein
VLKKVGDPLSGQPFWLAKVTRLSQMHITRWYYGDKFLGLNLYTTPTGPSIFSSGFAMTSPSCTGTSSSLHLTGTVAGHSLPGTRRC